MAVRDLAMALEDILIHMSVPLKYSSSDLQEMVALTMLTHAEPHTVVGSLPMPAHSSHGT